MQDILKAQAELSNHAIYQSLNSIEAIRTFMSIHIYAVWDFMSLLKALQKKLTCVEVPWRPTPYPGELVRLINQIVLGEESDLDQNGKAISHFELYLQAMEEVGASTSSIKDFLGNLDFNRIPCNAQDFVRGNIQLAREGHLVEITASFFFGREKLIPHMFETILAVLNRENIQAPTFIYYLKRHIELDSEEHGPLAERCLNYLTAGNDTLKSMAQSAGSKAILERKLLWDRLLNEIVQKGQPAVL